MPNYEKLYKTGSVWRSLLSMAIPALITVLVMIFYNMADMFFIGRLGDTSMVAAVSVVSPVFSLIMGFATMIGIGGSTIIANELGAGNREKARSASSVCFWAAFLIGLALITVLLMIRQPLLSFLGTTRDMRGYASTYLTILSLGTPFLLISTTMANIVRSEGAIRDALFGNIAGTLTNIILDPLFILVFGWGVAGAAAATVIGNAAATFLYLLYMKRKAAVLTVSPAAAMESPAMLFPILALGIPNAVSTILSGFASTFSNRLLSEYGTAAIAAMAAAGKAGMIIAMVMMGICMGVQPLIAYNYGARDHARMREILQKLTLLTLGIGTVSAVLCFALRRALIGMFLRQSEAAALGEVFVPFLVLGAPFMGFYYISTNFLQAAKNAPMATVTSVLRQGIMLIPLLYALHHFFGLTGIAAAHTAADIGAALLSLLIALVQYRKETAGITALP
ncbi:MATE family efflux transporter [Lachnoclostridium sp. Marseille-P6806]|uniref:MATE family efflux transporter n=1 Tax=Lachnoclostridium sp. Marseille-P6806 TaxID=2364793 RepID=UPI00103211FA|nr:MATE family efflux transporter [Lachnoclostridium sp. Marseille-P6806]